MNDRVVSIGNGIPSAPSISLNSNGTTHKVVVATSDGTIYNEEIGGLAGASDIVGIDTWEEY